jgi:hypothetical protein
MNIDKMIIENTLQVTGGDFNESGIEMKYEIKTSLKAICI